MTVETVSTHLHVVAELVVCRFRRRHCKIFGEHVLGQQRAVGLELLNGLGLARSEEPHPGGRSA